MPLISYPTASARWFCGFVFLLVWRCCLLPFWGSRGCRFCPDSYRDHSCRRDRRRSRFGCLL